MDEGGDYYDGRADAVPPSERSANDKHYKPPFALPQATRSRKRAREPDGDELPQLLIPALRVRRFDLANHSEFNLARTGEFKAGPRRGGSDCGSERAVEEDYEDYPSDNESEFAELSVGTPCEEASEDEEQPHAAPAATAAPPAPPGNEPPKPPPIRIVTVEPDELRLPRERLENALKELGYEDLADAQANCQLCMFEYNISEGASEYDTSDDPGTPGALNRKTQVKIIEGMNRVYAKNLDAPESVLFGTLQDYWERTLVAIHRSYNQQPLRLTREQFQLHFQWCHEDHPVECFRPLLRQTKAVLNRMATNGLFAQDYQANRKVGDTYVQSSTYRWFRQTVRDFLALKNAQHEQMNLYRSNFGIKPNCPRPNKRRKTGDAM